MEAFPGNDGFEPLLALARPDLYRRNLFRVLGLRVTASPADVRKQQKRVEMERRLGLRPEGGGQGGLVLESAPGEEELRRAQERLADPEARLLDELFWFWPLQPDGAADPALDALDGGQVEEARRLWEREVGAEGRGQIAAHNLAVLDHLLALDGEAISQTAADGAGPGLDQAWAGALGSWRTALQGDQLRDRLSRRVRELDDARLTTGVARRIVATLPRALLSINAALALASASRSDPPGVQRQVRAVQQAQLGDGLGASVLREGLRPLRDRLGVLCEDARRRAAQAEAEPATIGRELAGQVRPLLDAIDLVLPEGDVVREGVHDAAAQAVDACCTIHWNLVKDAAATVELLELGLGLARGAPLRARLETELKEFRELLEATRCWFCGKRPGDDACKYEVPMVRNVSSVPIGNGVRTTWSSTKIAVGRCKECKVLHEQTKRTINRFFHLVWVLGGAAVAAAIVVSSEPSRHHEWALPLLIGGVVGAFGGVLPAGLALVAATVVAPKRCLARTGTRPALSAWKHPSVKRMNASGWSIGE